MGFWLTLFLYVGFTVIGELLRPKQKLEEPKPSGLGDFRVPTAEEGRVIPVLWGRCKIAGPNVVWYGDLEVEKITEKVRTGLFSSERITKGYRYYLGEQLALCHGPIDSVQDILFDEKSVYGGRITVVDGKNGLRFGNVPPPWYTATIPVGTYDTQTELAIATEDAMQSAHAGTWKVIFGYHFVLGRTSKIVYAVKFSGVATNIEVDVGGAWLRGRDCAFMLEAALNKAERQQSGGARVKFFVSYSEPNTLGGSLGGTGKFTIHFAQLRSGVEGFYLRGIVDYDESALPVMGWQMGIDKFVSGTSGSLESDYETHANKYTFAFGGLGGKIDWGAAETTCGELFGAGSTDQVVIKSFLCKYPRRGPAFLDIQDLDSDRIRAVISANGLFGGDDREGGVSGAIDIWKGTATQQGDDYLEAVIGSDLPGYRGVCYAVFRHLYVGTTSYPKNPAFVLQRCPNQLGLAGGDHNINGDANPACMLYELMTDTRWGLGMSSSLIDVTNFQAVGAVLADEGFGLSMLLDGQASAANVISDICRHIDGVVFTDPLTGKIKLVLARSDYDFDDLPVIDGDAAEVKISSPSWEETANTVKVRFTSRAEGFTERVVSAQDLANIQTRNGIITAEEFDFTGISNLELAQRVTARVLNTRTRPLRRIEIPSVDRRANKLYPGSVFKLVSAKDGITGTACRVDRIAKGSPQDGRIRIDAVEDIFGVNWTAYPTSGGSGWVDPLTQPQVAEQRVDEAPITVASGEYRRIITMAVRPTTGQADGYKVWSDDTGGADYVETQDVTQFTPLGELAEGIDAAATTLTINPVQATELLTSASAAQYAAGFNILVVGDEWIAFRDVEENEDGTLTLSPCARGVVDTAPRAHESGAGVLFLTAGHGLTQDDPYAGDGDVSIKLLPYGPDGTMPLHQAQALRVTLASRAFRPFCPTNFKVNGAAYPTAVAGDLVLTWSHRDRTDTWEYDDSGITAGIETGTHHRVRIYNEDGDLLHTEDNITGASFTYTQDDERGDNGGDLAASLRVVVDTIQDAGDELESWQSIDHAMTRSDVSNPGDSVYGDNFCGAWGT